MYHVAEEDRIRLDEQGGSIRKVWAEETHCARCEIRRDFDLALTSFMADKMSS